MIGTINIRSLSREIYYIDYTILYMNNLILDFKYPLRLLEYLNTLCFISTSLQYTKTLIICRVKIDIPELCISI